MLNDGGSFSKVILAVGYTDLRRGIECLASIVKFKYNLDPHEKNVLFLFCGTRSDRIKGLLWEGDGFLLLYKRLDQGAFSWPRTTSEAIQLTRGAIQVADGWVVNRGTPSHKGDRSASRDRMNIFVVQNREISARIFMGMPNNTMPFSVLIKHSYRCQDCCCKP